MNTYEIDVRLKVYSEDTDSFRVLKNVENALTKVFLQNDLYTGIKVVEVKASLPGVAAIEWVKVPGHNNLYGGIHKGGVSQTLSMHDFTITDIDDRYNLHDTRQGHHLVIGIYTSMAAAQMAAERYVKDFPQAPKRRGART